MPPLQNRHLDDLASVDWIDHLVKGSNFIGSMAREFYYGVRSQTLPWALLYLASSFIAIAIRFNLDSKILTRLHIPIFDLRGTILYWPYCCFWILSPFWLWAGTKAHLARRARERLIAALIHAGLKNSLNKVPRLIFDKPIDQHTRRLRLTKAGFTKRQFEGAKHALETNLQIYIDSIDDDLERGIVDLIYGHKAMLTHVPLGSLDKIKSGQFIIGQTRSKTITIDMRECPHLLIAGTSGGGKSTFLRQVITTLYSRTPGAHFTLIDLKGGLEFQLFAKYKNIQVTETVEDAIEALRDVSLILDSRMTLLRLNEVKDVQAYEAISIDKRKKLPLSIKQDHLKPHFIVIDEVAEMFLSGSHASTQYTQQARKCLSQVARQGRSSDVHLLIATQRPDVKAIDSQVKANLSGILSFHMANAASSMTVLGNWRAAELPKIAGRAIWKVGAEMLELQTPILEPNEVEVMLEDYVRDEPKVKGCHPQADGDASGGIKASKGILSPASPFPDFSKANSDQNQNRI